jgi:very-short-patch-repair endonuclease
MVSRVVKARQLRREQTDAERALFRLRDRRLKGLKFRRQAPVGDYIVDFCCEASRLIIELDGGQHATRSAQDERRSSDLTARGYLVLRFWNHEVLWNMDGVLGEIAPTLKPIPPHPNPLSGGERECA